MKRSRFLSILASLAALAVFFAACAGNPKPAPKPVPEKPTAPEVHQKVQKERQITVKTPVLIKETALYPDGLVDQILVYKYDPALKQLGGRDTFDGSRPDPIERLVAEGKDGVTTAETTYDTEGKVRLRKEYSYSAAGLLTAEKSFDGKGNSQTSSFYAYDASGNKIEWKVYDGKSVLKAVTKYVYKDKRLVLIEMSDGQGAKTGTISCEYDATGNLTKKTYKAADGSLQKYEANQWEKGRLLSVEVHRADGSLQAKTSYVYGDLGQVLSLTTTDAAGKIKDRRTYEFSVREDQKTEIYWE